MEASLQVPSLNLYFFVFHAAANASNALSSVSIGLFFSLQYGIKKKEEKEAEAAAAMEQASEGSLTRPKKAVPAGCGDEEEEESIVDTVMKFIPTPIMDIFNKK